MDISSYIASGILQEYALGIASDQERREVQCLAKIYPEIAEALTVIESDIEVFAGAYAKKTPSPLRDKILGEVHKHKQLPASVTPNKSSRLAPNVKVIEMKPERGKKNNRINLPWAAAAAVLLLFAVWQFMDKSATKGELQKVKTAQLSLASEVDRLKQELIATSEELGNSNKELEEAFDPAIKKVVLTSGKEKDEVQLALFWNTRTGQIKVDPSTLPELSPDMQYQLWVLLDGNPIDMGIIDKDATEIIIASGITLTGQAFAITVEPLGGNASPTLEKLIVLGLVT